MIAGCFGTSFEWATGVLLLTAENNCLSRNQVCTWSHVMLDFPSLLPEQLNLVASSSQNSCCCTSLPLFLYKFSISRISASVNSETFSVSVVSIGSLVIVDRFGVR